MEKGSTRIALIGIIIEDIACAEETNRILHEYAGYIVGRMGLPYRERGLHIISVVLDAPEPAISALAGRLGQVEGASVKTMLSKTSGGGNG